MPEFESFVERSSLVVTVVDEDGTIRYQNPAIEEACGYSADELLDERFRDYLHPNDRERVGALIDDSERTLEADGAIQYRFRGAEGTWVWLEAIDGPIPDPGTGHRAIASRPFSPDTELERRLERYEVLLDSLDDAVYAIDPDGKIVYVNEAYAAMKGVDRDSLLGTHIYRWGSAEAAERIMEARAAMDAGERDIGTVEFEFSHVEGDRIPVELRFSVVSTEDNDLERVGVLRDISERRERERALERKNERLEEFASIVSHDLRNPLNVADGRIALASEECDSPHLDDAAGALERMNLLIDDLLRLARHGEVVSDVESVDLAELAETSWRTVETGEATLQVTATGEILADPSRLQQLFENLFRNAVEHGGSSVTVTVGSRESGFYVEDDGAGIPPAERETVFEAGYSTGDEGTGFGLSIVSQIAEAHGWDVSVTDGTDGGARFEVNGVDYAS